MIFRVSRRKIILKQIAYMVIPCVLTVVLVLVSIININRTVETKNRKLFSALAYEMKMLVDNILTDADAIVYSISTDSSLYANLQAIFEETSVAYENLMLFRAYQNSFDIAVKSRPYIESLYCLPLIGEEYPVVIAAGEGAKAFERSSDRSFMEACLADPQLARGYLFRDKNSLTTSSLVNRVLTKRLRATSVDRTRLLGDLIINLNASYIGKLIANLLNPESGVLYAITLGGEQIIWASDVVKENPQLLLLAGGANTGKWSKVDGDKYALVESLPLDDIFQISVFASKQALLLSDGSLVVSTILVIFISIVIGIVVIVLYTRKKYEDVALFSDYLNAIDTQGALSLQPVPEVEFDDMDANLVKEFMISDYINLHISQRELKERTLELEMLKKQLNPHFLLNTMQMLNWRIMSELNGYTELNLIVENLTKILSYSLHPTDFLAKFEEEQSYTDAYVSLLNRISARTTELVWDIPQHMHGFSIPRQLFQPLVENALKYAFKDVHPNLRPKIVIKAEEYHDDMLIFVSDNGKGIEPEMVAKLNTCFELELLEESIGLANTNKRIKLLFGTRFGLHVRSTLGESTSIEIRLPRIMWKEE